LLKGAIFDLGGTLIHLTVSWDQVREGRMTAIHETLREHKLELDFDELHREYLKLHEEESEYAARTLEEIEMEKTFSKLLDRLGIEMRQRPPMVDLVKRSFALELNSWALFPGVHEMLHQVRDMRLKIGLLSNARSDWAVREILEHLDLTKYFDVIVTSAAVGYRKPRPEPFQHMLERLNLSAGEAVMIGNSMEADVAGARSLGIKTIHVVFGDNADEGNADPDATVLAVPDVVPAIKRIAANC